MANLQAGTVIVARYDVTARTQVPWGTGEAWEATDRIFSRNVLIYELSAGADSAAMDTARDIAQITQDGIIRIVDILTKDDHRYVITEKPDGTTLFDLIAGGTLSIRQARAIIGIVATTLKDTHERGYAHGSLTPAHIWLSGSRIAIHGLAARNVLGDNKALGDGAIARDIRGLAALFYFALTGIMPDYNSREPNIIPLVDALPSAEHDLKKLTTGILMGNTALIHSAEAFLGTLGPWNTDDIPFIDLQPDQDPSDSPKEPQPVVRTSTRATPSTGRAERIPGTPPVAPYKHSPEPSPTRAKIEPVTSPQTPPTIPQRTPVLSPRNTVEPDHTMARPSRYASSSVITLVFFGLLLLGGLVWAMSTFNAPYEPAIVAPSGRPSPSADVVAGEDNSDGSSGETTKPADPPKVVVPVIASAKALDPQGDENEHPELEDRLVDGDSTSIWYSRTYSTPNFGNLKSGIGIEIKLEEKATVSSVLVSSANSGGNVEVRATNAKKPEKGKVLAEGPLDGETQFRFDESVETDSLVLWFTELPLQDGENRAFIYEISVT